MKLFVAKFATITNVALLIVMLAAIAYHVRDLLLPIHEVRSVEVLTPQIRRGEKLRYRLTIYRRELCDPKVYRFIFRRNEDGKREMVQQFTFIGAVSGTGLQIYDQSLNIDPNLPPGRYETGGFVVNTCAGLNRHEVVMLILQFEIVP